MNMLNWLEENIGRRYGNFIEGEWQDAGANAVPISNPARKDQTLGYFADSSVDDVNRAIESAHRAWKLWREVPGPERGAILFRAADILERRIDDIAFALSAEQGKILAESRGEVMRAGYRHPPTRGPASGEGRAQPVRWRSAGDAASSCPSVMRCRACRTASAPASCHSLSIKFP